MEHIGQSVSRLTIIPSSHPLLLLIIQHIGNDEGLRVLEMGGRTPHQHVGGGPVGQGGEALGRLWGRGSAWAAKTVGRWVTESVLHVLPALLCHLGLGEVEGILRISLNY